MEKVHGDLRAPGNCIICQRTTLQPGEHMIDTHLDNDEGGALTSRTGRIYVCYICVDTMARVDGRFVLAEDVEDERAAYAAAQDELDAHARQLSEAHAALGVVVDNVPALAAQKGR